MSHFLHNLSQFPSNQTQGGRWSSEGIDTVIVSNEHVQCLSSHLTSFAILVIVSNETQVRELASIHYIKTMSSMYIYK